MSIRNVMRAWLIRWLLARVKPTVIWVPNGCTLYVPEPTKLPAYDRILYGEGAQVVFGPPPEPGLFPWPETSDVQFSDKD